VSRLRSSLDSRTITLPTSEPWRLRPGGSLRCCHLTTSTRPFYRKPITHIIFSRIGEHDNAELKCVNWLDNNILLHKNAPGKFESILRATVGNPLRQFRTDYVSAIDSPAGLALVRILVSAVGRSRVDWAPAVAEHLDGWIRNARLLQDWCGRPGITQRA